VRLNDFPSDVTAWLLSFLCNIDLGYACRVCRAWCRDAALVFRGKTKLDLRSRVMPRDLELGKLLDRCPRASDIEVDCNRATELGAMCLDRPAVRRLTLAGLDHQRDTFLSALSVCGGHLTYLSMTYFGDHFTRKSLSRLGESLTRLESLSVEFGFKAPSTAIVTAAVKTAYPTLRQLTVTDIDRPCLQLIASHLSRALEGLSYTRTSLNGMPIDDELLQYIALRFRNLSTLKLIDNVQPTVLIEAHQAAADNAEQGACEGSGVGGGAAGSAGSSRRGRRRQAAARRAAACAANGGNPANARRHFNFPPLVTAGGLSHLKRLFGKLRVLHLCRGFSLPFTHTTDVDLMQTFAGLPSSMEELQLDGFTNLSDACLHEALFTSAAPPRSSRPSVTPRGSQPPIPISITTTTTTTTSSSSAAASGSSGRLRVAAVGSGPAAGLRRLSLENTAVSDVALFSISTILGSQLEWLSLKRCKGVSEAGLATLAEHCPELVSLNLGSCSGVNDMSVVGLFDSCRKITSLVLNDAKITDRSLRAVGEYLGDSLTELALHRCDNITNAGLDALSRGCPQLVLLSLSMCNHISDYGIKQIAQRCTFLQKLRLDGTRISNSAVRSCCEHLKRLRQLHLHKCWSVSGAVLVEFTDDRLPFLKVVEILRHKVEETQIHNFTRQMRPEVALVLHDAYQGWSKIAMGAKGSASSASSSASSSSAAG